MKTVLILAGCSVLCCVVIGAVIWQTSHENARREAERQALMRELDAPTAAWQPVIAAPLEEPAPVVVPATAPSIEPGKLDQPKAQTPNRPRRQNSAPRNAQAPLPIDSNSDKPIARQALALVGADPVAEQVWMQAINDPNTSAHDRSDLIEDLNEDGFDDPHNLTADDLPLIENRLALIEQVGPFAMDDVNAAAFAEAYKDLVNMQARLTGR